MNAKAVSSMTVAALRKELRGKGQDARGNKATLVARLTAVLTSENRQPSPEEAKPVAQESAPIAEEEPIENYEEIEEEPVTAAKAPLPASEEPVAPAEEKAPEAEGASVEMEQEDILSEEKMKKRALRFGLPWPPPAKSVVEKEDNPKSTPQASTGRKGKRARELDRKEVDESSPKKKIATGKKGKKQQNQKRNNISGDDGDRSNGRSYRGYTRGDWEEDRVGSRAGGRDDRVPKRGGRDERRGEEGNRRRREGRSDDGRGDRVGRRSADMTREVNVNGGIGKRGKNSKRRTPKSGVGLQIEKKNVATTSGSKVEISAEERAKREARAKRFAVPPKPVAS